MSVAGIIMSLAFALIIPFLMPRSWFGQYTPPRKKRKPRPEAKTLPWLTPKRRK